MCCVLDLSRTEGRGGDIIVTFYIAPELNVSVALEVFSDDLKDGKEKEEARQTLVLVSFIIFVVPIKSVIKGFTSMPLEPCATLYFIRTISVH